MPSSSASTVRRLPNRDTALKALYDDLSAKHMFPFWATSTDVEHDEVRQLLATAKAVPYLWRCAEDIEPILSQAVELITMDDSERRSVVLVNPGLAPRRATVSTMYTAYRLNDANEIMPPHTHSPSAIRFGLNGKGNFTGVDGENIVFGPGDMVLTPNDTWHNHGTVGNEQALNLSVLDLPLVETLNAIHFDHDYKEEENGKLVSKKSRPRAFPATIRSSSTAMAACCRALRAPSRAAPAIPRRCSSIAGRWCASILDAKDRDGDAHDGLMVEYIDPTTGQPVFKTMTFFAQMLHPGAEDAAGAKDGEPAGVPFEGTGYSVVDGSVTTGRKFDTLAIPGGSWFEHHNELRRRSRCSCSSPATSRH